MTEVSGINTEQGGRVREGGGGKSARIFTWENTSGPICMKGILWKKYINNIQVYSGRAMTITSA